MNFTVAIPTYHRDQNLHELLDALAPQLDDAACVLVLDNAAQASTRRLVQERGDCFSTTFSYLAVPAPGVANARNAAVQHAAGDVLAFLDDDVLPAPDWFATLKRLFAELPDADALGGKIELLWETPRPRFLSNHFLARLGALDHAAGLTRISYPLWINGANMAFRTRVFARVGLFAADLGRRGAHLLSSEEPELCLRLERMGGVIYYAPSLVVQHRVQKKHTAPAYLLRKGYWQAVSDARVDSRHSARSTRGQSVRTRWSTNQRAFGDLFQALRKHDFGRSLVAGDRILDTLGYLHGTLVE